MIDQSRPPVLLTIASYYGTLAAARCLGRAGVPVTMADPRVLAPARWSRYVTRRERCPTVDDPERFIDWLVQFGKRAPGHVLYPTSDEGAWLFSLHRDVLAEHYRLFQPSLDAVQGILDKRELFAACQQIGIDAPVTHFPRDDEDLERIGRGASFPLLLKPTTQVLLQSHHKGVVVPDRAALRSTYDLFRAMNQYHPWVVARAPGVGQPMLQEFRPEAAVGIYSVAGFMDTSGVDGVVALAARKVLQRPRKLGIGLCFEEAGLRADVEAALTALCRHVGYYGVFEAEFIEADGRLLLIDFNPRFYSQMAFEIDRGLPLPLLAYEAALGRRDALRQARRALDERRALAPGQQRVYTHRSILRLMTTLQRLSGKMTRAEAAHWSAWYRTHRGRVSDAVIDREDWLPTLVDLASTAVIYGQHPRAFVRTMVFDR